MLRSESINAFSAVLSTEGRVVGLCWANYNLKDLKDLHSLGRPDGASKELTRSLSRDSSWELGYGERRCGFNEKHQSTTMGRVKADGVLVCV